MLTVHRRTCHLCEASCGIVIEAEDRRIVSIKGSRANPYTAGVLCAKVPEAYPGFVHGAGRLKTPLRRTGAKGEGRFERISWAQAGRNSFSRSNSLSGNVFITVHQARSSRLAFRPLLQDGTAHPIKQVPKRRQPRQQAIFPHSSIDTPVDFVRVAGLFLRN